MTIPENTEQQQLLVIDYLYGDWDDARKQEFEALLVSNESLRKRVDEERRFDQSFPVGAQPHIDQERLEGNRWLLRQNLQKVSRSRFFFRDWLNHLIERPLNVVFQAGAMAMTFVLGIMVASPEIDLASSPDGAVIANESVGSPLSLVNDEDFEIYKLKVNSYDAVTGDIDLSFALASESRLQGNVADSTINQLMAVALQDDIDSAARLDTINALQPVVSGDQVYEALIYVLMNDQNPGVRYQAVQSLVALSDQDRVKQALRVALQEDVNPGVRIEAFNALTEYRDEQTLSVFRARMDADSSEYIRSQARLIIEEAESDSVTL